MMLSCGSGSVAAAFHASQTLGIQNSINVTVPGGELNVKFDSNWENVWLTGLAILPFTSSIHLENL